MIDEEVAQRMRFEGSTYQDIATLFDVSRQRVHQFLSGYKAPSSRDKIKRREHRRRGTCKREELKNTVLTYYGGGRLACVRCGFTDIKALSLDHINGDGWKHRHIGGGINLYGKLLAEGYPEGYQTLCMNCQFIKRVDNSEIRH